MSGNEQYIPILGGPFNPNILQIQAVFQILKRINYKLSAIRTKIFTTDVSNAFDL